jgi:hypothetical protein
MNHGVTRVPGGRPEKTAEVKRKEQKEIEAYQKLIDEVSEGVSIPQMQKNSSIDKL